MFDNTINRDNSMQDFFKLGMKRGLPELLRNCGNELEIGPGNTPVKFASTSIEYPAWDGDTQDLPYENNKFDVIHAYHILEHLNDPIRVLKECERVLKIGGHMNIVVPHQMSALAYSDLDHKHFFNEETFSNIFHNKGYSKDLFKWQFKIHICFIMGVVQHNMGLFVQLKKEDIIPF